jgi:hypothetical protein
VTLSTRETRLPAEGNLPVRYASYEAARAHFPHDQRIAIRAFINSEAARFANKVVFARHTSSALPEIVAGLIDTRWVAEASLRSRRFDLMAMLVRSERFGRRIINRLLRQGKISAEVAARVVMP